jgi:hypothetical protein
VTLTFWRWVNGGAVSGNKQVVPRVEVWDPVTAAFVGVWQTIGVVADSSWTRIEIDVTAYKSATFALRFGFSVGNGPGTALAMSGWNVDDLTLSSGTCD